MSGGATKRQGGGGRVQVKFDPTMKRVCVVVCRKSFRHSEWGQGTTSFGVVLTQKLEILAIMKGDANSFTVS